MAKKPIYKRVWPYVVAGVLVIGGIGGGASESNLKETEEPPRIIEAEDQQAAPTEVPLQTLVPVTSSPVQAERTMPTDPKPTEEPKPKQEPLPVSTPEPIQEQTPLPTEGPVETPNVKGCFITPTGKKYHIDKECAGPNAIPISIDDAIARGYGPCKTCAGG